MKKVLFCNIPESNHLIPMMWFMQEFNRYGDTGILATGDQMAEAISNSPVEFKSVNAYSSLTASPYGDDLDDFYSNLFQYGESALQEYTEIIEETTPDIILTGGMDYPAAVAAESSGKPWFVLSTVPGALEPESGLPFTGRGIAGAGIQTKVIRYFHRRRLRKYHSLLNGWRINLGLKSLENTFTTQMLQSTQYLALAVQSMEPAEPDFSDQVKFIGPVPRENTSDNSDEPWLNQLSSPVILIALQDFEAPDTHILVNRAIDALGNTEVSVIVEAPGSDLPDLLPENFHHRSRLQVPSLLPSVNLMIHRGNYQEYARSILEGLPSIIVTAGAESRELAVRAENAGMAVITDIDGFRTDKIGNMITRLLKEPLYRMMAERLKEKFRGIHSVKDTVRIMKGTN